MSHIKTTEEDQVVKAVKTRQSTEPKIATLASIIEYQFENVKKNHAESKKIAVQVFGEENKD